MPRATTPHDGEQGDRGRGIPLVIVGGASLDTLILGGAPHQSIGGAGLYTALAATVAGARPLMIAPLPTPMPSALQWAARHIAWLGPGVSPDELPHFEIAQGDDGSTVMGAARWGTEATLDPSWLPAAAPGTMAYIGPLATPTQQLAFLRRARTLGYRTACGTYPRAVDAHAAVVRELLAEADIFFCNAYEASALFGAVEAAVTAPGKLLFVTLGAQGVRVVQGSHATTLRGVSPPVTECTEAGFDADEASLQRPRLIDPTGAGDTFCGVTLAHLARGAHPVMAAHHGTRAASVMVTGIGPTVLLESGPLAPLVGSLPRDPSVEINDQQVSRVAAQIAALPEVQPFDFVGGSFPVVGDDRALDYFFTATLQQWGFWYDDGERYVEPLIAPVLGKPRKGSDYLWACYRRWRDEAPETLTPHGHATLDSAAMAHHLRDDTGRVPFRDMPLRCALARGYGGDLTAMGDTPATVLGRANASATPLATFVQALDHIGGYKEDPLRKKSVLLALILQQRPERFLRIEPAEAVPPVIDYHLQRSCLRTGLVTVRDEALHRRLVARALLTPDEEWAVRWASYQAIQAVQARSGRSMGAVDWFFFGARHRCPEMTEPQCPECPMEPVCLKQKDLFQPVLRTTFY